MSGWPASSLFLAVRPGFPTAASCATESAPHSSLPTVIVTAQKEAADIKDVPGSVTAVTVDNHHRRRRAHRHRRGDLRAEHGLHRVHGAQGEQRALPRHRLEPGQPGDHDLHRRRAAAQRNSSNIELLDVDQIEFVRGPQSPLFGRNTLGGIDQRDAGAAVDCRSGPARRRAVRQLRRHGGARQRLGTGRRQGRDRLRRAATSSATATPPTRSPATTSTIATARSRKAQLHVAAQRQLGGARDLCLRARSRRRLCARRSRRDPRRRRSALRATSRASPIATSTT